MGGQILSLSNTTKPLGPLLQTLFWLWIAYLFLKE